MFKKLLAAVGVGGAMVDTVLDKPSLRPGDTLTGKVLIKGGSVPQSIEYVDLVLMTEVEKKINGEEYRASHALQRYRVSGAIQLSAGQDMILPFALGLPLETPVNNAQALASPGFQAYLPRVRAAVWIHTDLAIASARDAEDRDFLDIHPLPQMLQLISAMSQLGYAHVSSDVEAGAARFNNIQSSLGCYQEFEFKPTRNSFGGAFSGSSVKEVEITCIPRTEGVHVLLEVDRRYRGDSYRSLLMGADWQHVNWQDQLQRVLA